MNDLFSVTIRGCRGSYAKPGSQTIRYGGNTTCIEVRIADCLIILDAGTGIVSLGQELVEKHKSTGVPIVANIFFTHIHHDHTEGFPFFEPAYFQSTTLNIFGPNTFSKALIDVLSHAMLPPYFPVEFFEMKSKKQVQELSDGDMVALCPHKGVPKEIHTHGEKYDRSNNDIILRVLHGYSHPKGGIYIYSVAYNGKKMVFATDTEGYTGGDQRLIRFAKGADLLIHDCQFTTETYVNPATPRQGWGHSTVEMAVDVAKKAGVGRLVLTHHDPNDNDEKVDMKESQAKELFDSVECAREGAVYNL
ncbi:MAG: MBL fold metallo-hydrolase [Candidatus Auribacterota bacterium]|jgi:phosphoribosyl 1,2-cyclic phosphodiesterase|nr:MBL fold metallo-hydrolase [Candidatus Auribacterota bacterium]